MRTLSWTFVFGAIAALAYTSFKPAWNDLLGGDMTEAQVRGTLIAKDAKAEREKAPETASVDCRSVDEPKPEICASPDKS